MALKAVKELNKEKLLGFDTESRPCFKKGEFHHISLLQLCGENAAYLFRLNYIKMPPELLELLSNPKIIKVGVAIRDDLLGLKKLSEFEHKGFIELADLVKSMGVKSLGLRSMAGYFLRKKISKGAKLTNWENQNLKKSQLIYAATDAWIGKELYLHFLNQGLIPK